MLRSITAAARPLGLMLPTHPWRWLAVGPVAGAAAGLLLAVAVAASLAPSASAGGPWPDSAASTIGAGLHGAIAMAFLSAAVPEELLFHGVGLLLPAALLGWTRGQQVAAGAIGTVLFAVLHAPHGARNAVAALLVGAVYTALTIRSSCLWPAVLAHGYYNTTLLLLANP